MADYQVPGRSFFIYTCMKIVQNSVSLITAAETVIILKSSTFEKLYMFLNTR